MTARAGAGPGVEDVITGSGDGGPNGPSPDAPIQGRVPGGAANCLALNQFVPKRAPALPDRVLHSAA